MTLSLYDASVPVFKQMLGGLDAVLDKSQALAAARKFEPNALTEARLYPDMFPLSKQVQIACDFARGVSARLAGADVPVYEDKEKSVDELRALIARTLAFVESLDAANFDDSASREIVLRPGTPKEKRLTGTNYLLRYGTMAWRSGNAIIWARTDRQRGLSKPGPAACPNRRRWRVMVGSAASCSRMTNQGDCSCNTFFCSMRTNMAGTR